MAQQTPKYAYVLYRIDNEKDFASVDDFKQPFHPKHTKDYNRNVYYKVSWPPNVGVNSTVKKTYYEAQILLLGGKYM